ncbi:methytransferase partner Trm112 [Candidatus Methanoliparum sp. LAM-1]|uniref:methytransferase partner Trm112 n=1 Tax=Candidatus Methanoliparum sp. LAM-1 TaxID=2874846 RepID=UPI001E61CB32|nr:methytransferase partner Trm112 [Candidatus Methanoliparum sp. LAM-1]BDC35651.1 hypothetical protein MTLP_03330 [Candidatus Methanoliparum sp. LAM-1]
MWKNLVKILACPICKKDLLLIVDEEQDNDVIKGYLYCSRCNERYPIEDGIPVLLPLDQR